MGILRIKRRERGAGETAIEAGRKTASLIEPAGDKLRRRAIWLVGILAAMAGTTQLLLDPPAFLLAKHPEPATIRPEWTEIRKPIPLYAFAGGIFGQDPRRHTARRHSDGSRRDIMGWGDFDRLAQADRPWMQLKVLRNSGKAGPKPGFFVEMARLAAGEGLAVTRNRMPDLVETRFGAFAIGDIQVTGPQVTGPQATGPASPAGATACLGFVRHATAPALAISGIVCGAAAAPVDRKLLACTLNRLYAVSARDDRELRSFFARAELGRGDDCLNAKTAGMRNRAAWLEQPAPQAAVEELRLRALPEKHASRR